MSLVRVQLFRMVEILFYVGGLLTVLTAMLVINTKNPVYAVFYLIIVFFNVCLMLILLELDFFGMIFLIVYVGAIAILFLFVVMLLNIRVSELQENKLSVQYILSGGLIAILFFLMLFLIFEKEIGTTNVDILSLEMVKDMDYLNILNKQDNILVLAQQLYSKYAYQLIIGSGILLIAMIGAMHLSLDDKDN